MGFRAEDEGINCFIDIPFGIGGQFKSRKRKEQFHPYLTITFTFFEQPASKECTLVERDDADTGPCLILPMHPASTCGHVTFKSITLCEYLNCVQEGRGASQVLKTRPDANTSTLVYLTVVQVLTTATVKSPSRSQ